MFTIIGGDGKEYGPATLEQIRSWIVSGRANLDTKAKALGSDEWRRLGDYLEFSSPDAPPPINPPVAAFTSAAAPIPGAQPAGRGARIGGALFNAFLYFLCMMPGSMMMSTRLMKENPGLLQGGVPRFDELNLAG